MPVDPSPPVQGLPMARSPPVGGGASGPGFSAPFDLLEGRMHNPVPEPEPVEVVFLEAAEDTRRLEAELARVVLVMVTGTRPAVDVDGVMYLG